MTTQLNFVFIGVFGGRGKAVVKISAVVESGGYEGMIVSEVEWERAVQRQAMLRRWKNDRPGDVEGDASCMVLHVHTWVDFMSVCGLLK